jgi:hypothetical protein
MHVSNLSLYLCLFSIVFAASIDAAHAHPLKRRHLDAPSLTDDCELLFSSSHT